MIAYRPLLALLPRALADMANRGAAYAERVAAARALGFILQEMPLVSEQVKTDILVALRACVRDPEVVHQVLAALGHATRDDPRWPRAIIRLADAALDAHEEQTFHVLVEALVEAPTFSGELPARWPPLLLRSTARRSVVLITERYARRFGASIWSRVSSES